MLFIIDVRTMVLRCAVRSPKTLIYIIFRAVFEFPGDEVHLSVSLFSRRAWPCLPLPTLPGVTSTVFNICCAMLWYGRVVRYFGMIRCGVALGP